MKIFEILVSKKRRRHFKMFWIPSTGLVFRRVVVVIVCRFTCTFVLFRWICWCLFYFIIFEFVLFFVCKLCVVIIFFVSGTFSKQCAANYLNWLSFCLRFRFFRSINCCVCFISILFWLLMILQKCAKSVVEKWN